MSWVYWPPKSRTGTTSTPSGTEIAFRSVVCGWVVVIGGPSEGKERLYAPAPEGSTAAGAGA